jgi:hypothetical protein
MRLKDKYARSSHLACIISGYPPTCGGAEGGHGEAPRHRDGELDLLVEHLGRAGSGTGTLMSTLGLRGWREGEVIDVVVHSVSSPGLTGERHSPRPRPAQLSPVAALSRDGIRHEGVLCGRLDWFSGVCEPRQRVLLA